MAFIPIYHRDIKISQVAFKVDLKQLSIFWWLHLRFQYLQSAIKCFKIIMASSGFAMTRNEFWKCALAQYPSCHYSLQRSSVYQDVPRLCTGARNCEAAIHLTDTMSSNSAAKLMKSAFEVLLSPKSKGFDRVLSKVLYLSSRHSWLLECVWLQ